MDGRSIGVTVVGSMLCKLLLCFLFTGAGSSGFQPLEFATGTNPPPPLGGLFSTLATA